MRRFFVVLLVLSLLATAGAFYWRTYYPEHTAAQAPAAEAGKRSITPNTDGTGARSFREAVKLPSDRQDLAVTISILSSVVSALAAVLQTWLTARAFRR